MNRLESFEVLSPLSDRDRDTLDALLAVAHFEVGERLCTQGQDEATVYLVVRGRVSIDRGKRRLRVVGPGALVGQTGMIQYQQRTANAHALEPVEALVLHRDTLEEGLHQGAPWALALFDEVSPSVARQVRVVMDETARSTSRGLASRLANLLRRSAVPGDRGDAGEP